MTNEYTDTPFIFIGRVTLESGKIGMRFISANLLRTCTTREQAEQLSSCFPVTKQREIPRAVGFIYTIKATVDDQGVMNSVSGNYTIAGTDQSKNGINPAWLAHWQAADRVRDVQERARKIEAKYDRDELRDRLKPLRQDYFKTDKIGRLALEVMILDILRNS